jgi:hypothetical protein
MNTAQEASKVSKSETLTGIVIAQFWWGCGRIHCDMVYRHDGKPDYDGWNPTEYPNLAFHWQSKPAAYKFLRENQRLADAGYVVIDLADLSWPNGRGERVKRLDEVEGGDQ